MRWLARIPLLLAAILALGWCGLTLAYTIPGPPLVGQALAGAVILIGLLGFLVLGSFSRALALIGLIFLIVLMWFFSLRPPQDADWQADVSQLSHAELEGDKLVVHNVRNFDYRSETDYTPRWETRTYDLAKLDHLDMFFSHWSGPAIAHTIMSWSFSDGQHLAISIETRKTQNQVYSAVAGFFRQYPIYYVVADERDVVRLRTNYRGEHVWLYPLKTPPEAARALLLDYVKSINALHQEPEWYNALTDNCTTSIRRHVQHLQGGHFPLDWRLFVNGYLPELLYERGSLGKERSFAEIQATSNIDARAQAADQDPAFSARIREPAATQ